MHTRMLNSLGLFSLVYRLQLWSIRGTNSSRKRRQLNQPAVSPTPRKEPRRTFCHWTACEQTRRLATLKDAHPADMPSTASRASRNGNDGCKKFEVRSFPLQSSAICTFPLCACSLLRPWLLRFLLFGAAAELSEYFTIPCQRHHKFDRFHHDVTR
jgi:hypothetical protein